MPLRGASLSRHDRRTKEDASETLGRRPPRQSMTPPATLHTLLTGAIDYAGLFPPAALSMRDAVARYADYRGTAEAWALGRFIVPLARVDELVTAQRETGAKQQGWRLSVLLGDDPVADSQRIRSFNATHARSALIDSAEAKLGG